MSFHQTWTEPIASPGGFFKVAQTGRVHRVRLVRRMTYNAETWLSVEFWCGNYNVERRGSFLVSNANEGLRCERCDRDQRRALGGLR
jgi:hypothetical protein